jgi:phosphoglycerate dehydrogenase-like enzyme
MKIALLDDYLSQALRSADWSRLGDGVEIVAIEHPFASTADLVETLADFDVIVAMRERTPLGAEIFERLPNLRLVVTTGMRNLAIDMVAARRHGVDVCGTDMLPTPTAELAWGMILYLARRIGEQDAALRRGVWQTALGTVLAGKRLGIVGLGKLGGQMARIGRAFGMDVVAWSPNLTDEKAAAAGARRVDKSELFATSDVVTVHVVLSERSRGLVDGPSITAMKKTAFLVNTSRSGLVDMEALGGALEAGAIAGAGLDVFEVEPLPPNDPILGWPNTVLTPHLGYVTQETWRVAYEQAVEAIDAWTKRSPIRVLN